MYLRCTNWKPCSCCGIWNSKVVAKKDKIIALEGLTYTPFEPARRQPPAKARGQGCWTSPPHVATVLKQHRIGQGGHEQGCHAPRGLFVLLSLPHWHITVVASKGLRFNSKYNHMLLEDFKQQHRWINSTFKSIILACHFHNVHCNQTAGGNSLMPHDMSKEIQLVREADRKHRTWVLTG